MKVRGVLYAFYLGFIVFSCETFPSCCANIWFSSVWIVMCWEFPTCFASVWFLSCMIYGETDHTLVWNISQCFANITYHNCDQMWIFISDINYFTHVLHKKQTKNPQTYFFFTRACITGQFWHCRVVNLIIPLALVLLLDLFCFISNWPWVLIKYATLIFDLIDVQS